MEQIYQNWMQIHSLSLVMQREKIQLYVIFSLQNQDTSVVRGLLFRATPRLLYSHLGWFQRDWFPRLKAS